MASDLPTTNYELTPPDPSGTAGVFRRIGYKLEEAIADLIDNSIDAKARNVLIRFVRSSDQLLRVVIGDDGTGMTEDRLRKVMQYGVRVDHTKKDLGKYGIGLKSASFSQCSSLTVITRVGGETSARRWTMESIGQDWRVEVIDKEASNRFYDQLWGPLKNKTHGTLVVWDDLELPPAAESNFEKALAAMIRELTVNLGLRFHRFLESGIVRLHIDTSSIKGGAAGIPIPVTPLNPFGYASSGRRGFPIDFVVDLSSLGSLRMRAHIWPPKSKDPNYKLGGGKVATRQGFYFYRNDRLIEAGGWHGLQSDTEPHSSLARVEVNLPPELDSAFRLTVQKNGFQPPQAFLDAVRGSYAGSTSFSDYLKVADDTYRGKVAKSEPVPVPGSGIPSGVAKRIQKHLAGNGGKSDAVEVSFEWSNGLGEDVLFWVDRERQTIRLNQLYRSQITGGQNSKADAPLFKVLLFFLLEDVLSKRRVSGSLREELESLNTSLLEVVRGLG